MKKCDICDRNELTSYIDGKTIFGPWANICPTCYLEFGQGLGVGIGQLYNWYADKEVYKQESGGSFKGMEVV